MRKKRKGFLWRMIDTVMSVLTLAAAGGLLCAYIAPSVNPNTAWIFAYAGLATPVLYLANLFLLLYWAIRWKPLFFLPALLLLIGLPKLKTFYHFPGSSKQEAVETTEGITIMTYNVEGFLSYDKSSRVISSAREITDFIKEQDPDIICLQEFQATPKIPESTINEWLSGWPHRKIHYTVTRNGRGIVGQAIYSKFPIVSDGSETFPESYNGTLWVHVLVSKTDTLRVFCNHLETTYIKDEDIEFLHPENFATDPDKSGQIRKIAGRLRKGFRKRAHQADSVAALIASQEIPTIVCGDFNDPPMSYSYKTVRNGYGDTFEDKGSGYGYTYKRFYRLLRIDYILRSAELETVAYNSPDAEWSDHRPVIARIRFKTE